LPHTDKRIAQNADQKTLRCAPRIQNPHIRREIQIQILFGRRSFYAANVVRANSLQIYVGQFNLRDPLAFSAHFAQQIYLSFLIRPLDFHAAQEEIERIQFSILPRGLNAS